MECFRHLVGDHAPTNLVYSVYSAAFTPVCMNASVVVFPRHYITMSVSGAQQQYVNEQMYQPALL